MKGKEDSRQRRFRGGMVQSKKKGAHKRLGLEKRGDRSKRCIREEGKGKMRRRREET